MKDINRKRLEWLVDPRKRPPESVDVGLSPNQWAEAMADMAREALDELDSYRGIKVETSLVSGDQIVHIDGIKYARSLFEGIGLKTPLNCWIRLIERSNDGVVCIETAGPLLPPEPAPCLWRPIEEAPVEPWRPDIPSYYRFRCLLQLSPKWVAEGEGYWVASHPNRKAREPILRWRTHLGVCQPTHYQPLPLPFNEPLNEEKV